MTAASADVKDGTGVRIVHEKHRNCVVTVEIPHRPYTTPHLCPTCNVLHTGKTVHLWLDDVGSTVVSGRVLELLAQVGLPGFLVESEVVDPPGATIGFNGAKPPTVIREKPNLTIWTKGN